MTDCDRKVTSGHRSPDRSVISLDRVPSSPDPILRLCSWDMARGVEVVAPLPKVSFVRIDDDTLSKPAGVADNTARGFGCEHVSFGSPTDFGLSHGFTPQITMVPSFKDRSITFDIAVERFFAGMSEISLTLFPEPLEKELAVQVEYDMDEQGKFMSKCRGVVSR